MLTVENLEKDLKQGNLNSIYLLYGEETFLLESCLKKIKNNFGERKEGINEIKLDDTNVNSIISDMETPAFGYEKKIIIVRNSGLFKKEGKRKTGVNTKLIENVARYINENIETIKEAVVLVFVEKEIEKNELYKEVEKNGIVCEFQELKPIQLIARIKAICKAYKVNIDDNTAKYFIECAGTNMQDLINEIRKLIEYGGENSEITKKEIDNRLEDIIEFSDKCFIVKR